MKTEQPPEPWIVDSFKRYRDGRNKCSIINMCTSLLFSALVSLNACVVVLWSSFILQHFSSSCKPSVSVAGATISEEMQVSSNQNAAARR